MVPLCYPTIVVLYKECYATHEIYKITIYAGNSCKKILNMTSKQAAKSRAWGLIEQLRGPEDTVSSGPSAKWVRWW